MKTKVTIIEPDCVVVKQTVEEVTEGGIILTKESVYGGPMEKFEGTVLAIGDEVESVKVGDYVSFGRNAFSIKKWNDEEYFYIRERGLHTIELEVDEDVECKQNEFFV